MTATLQRPGIDQLVPLLARLTGDEKHELSAESTIDVIWVLYDRILRVDPARPDAEDRDRFLVSKGHGPHAYYAVLAAKGFFPVAWLDDLAGPESRLGHHPDRSLVPGVEIASGSLGHGLGLGVGIALGLRAQGQLGEGRWAGRAQGLRDPRVYVLLGDAELDEGSNHEAIAYAGAAGLGSLTAIVIDNHSAALRQELAGVFTVHGWSAATVDGRDHDALESALRRAARTGAAQDLPAAGTPGDVTDDRPHVVVADVGRES